MPLIFDLQTKVTIAAVGLLALCVAAGGGYYYGDKHADTEAALVAATLQLEQDAVIMGAVMDNETTKVELQEKKNENIKLINAIARLKPSSGVQLPCSPAGPTDPTTGSEPTTPGTGALPNETQRAFDRFTEGLDKLTLEADQLTEQCRVVADWAQGLMSKK